VCTVHTSARVGRGAAIIESSICVAVTTGLAAMLHLRIIIFCTCGGTREPGSVRGRLEVERPLAARR
jgi:hypothetical protein